MNRRQRLRELPSFREMPRTRVAFIGITITVLAVVIALFYDKIPGVTGGDTYRAEFAEVGNLRGGDPVEISGSQVGKVGSIRLTGNKVTVAFTIDAAVDLGDGTRAAIVTTSALGQRALRISPAGTGTLSTSTPIPLTRTTPPYSLPDALNDASQTLNRTDPDQLNAALRSLSEVAKESAPALSGALDGVTRLSRTIGSRNDQLRELLDKTQDTTAILADRSKQLNTLTLDANKLLGELQTRSGELERLIVGIRFVSQQLTGVIRENRAQLTPALTQLDGILSVLKKRKTDINSALTGLRTYSTGLGESISSGPFFLAYVGNFIPVQYIQPLVDELVKQAPKAGN
ncbi:phospholipid/cholesterol/gamma-HCH transport system substrate-binding protein [Williamsia maris]|uniref:Phospholipid/cholesterol/gamma-HCH transport system substrate-binding protein n=2 Tax=Williamsia maris TaxID=72806 RepID=A0ABT1HB90_9NOCA|nr:phospholipid/cholesterol/gamma-HCH transport system substrate-binding protein [Williamsia maris]